METPGDKFEGGVRLPSCMFSSAADMISLQDIETPAPSYMNLYTTWKNTVEDDISDILHVEDVEMDMKEDYSFSIGKQVTFRALEKFIERAKVAWSMQDVDTRKAAVGEILARPQVPQRTQEWYTQGRSVLTASEFSKLFGTPRCVNELVMSKIPSDKVCSTNRLACMTCEMGPFDWGVRFEPVVKQILEAKWNAKIVDTGRILHPHDTHIAASPDGIVLEAEDTGRIGRLVEIKCPITRKIGQGIPFDYWCQMQVQMEVTGIGECEYVEVKIDSIQGISTDLSGVVDGHLWLLQHPLTCEVTYVYKESDIRDGWDILEKIPWRLNDIYIVTVPRDRAWYNSTDKVQKQFWENVEKAQKGNVQVGNGRQKVIVTKEPVCMIVD
jgi:hypothetical protein